MAEIVVVRHGQTEWSAIGRHTSTTDLDLTAEGERQARALAPWLAGRSFTAVLTSPRLRACHTASLAGLTATVDEDLVEWDYGSYEGLTTAQIREADPDWLLWTDGAPGGESPAEVGARLDRVLDRIRAHLVDGDVLVFGHGHALRVLTARWLGLTAGDGVHFRLDSAAPGILGFEHSRPVLLRWNVPPSES